jgi:prevent-host-death family protein
MKHIGSYEAKTHLPRLLDSVEAGESIVVTRNGRPSAQLVPVTVGSMNPRTAIEGLKAYSRSRKRTLGRLSYRSLIEDGRRY